MKIKNIFAKNKMLWLFLNLPFFVLLINNVNKESEKKKFKKSCLRVHMRSNTIVYILYNKLYGKIKINDGDHKKKTFFKLKNITLTLNIISYIAFLVMGAFSYLFFIIFLHKPYTYSFLFLYKYIYG